VARPWFHRFYKVGREISYPVINLAFPPALHFIVIIIIIIISREGNAAEGQHAPIINIGTPFKYRHNVPLAHCQVFGL